MKILVIHQYYLFPGQAGGSRFNDLARRWVEAGHQVTVVAGTVKHQTGQSPKQYRRSLVSKEVDGAVDVLRCHVPRCYSKGYVGRMWGFLGFTITACFGVMRTRRPDVIIATSPPLITAIPSSPWRV